MIKNTAVAEAFNPYSADDQLAALAVQGMLLTWKEKLLGQEFNNLGQLAQQVVALNSQFQSMRRDTRF